MSTFRQKISQIECPATEFTTCEDCCNDMSECEHKIRIDAICAVLAELAEGMVGLKGFDHDDRDAHDWGVACGIERCQAYLKKEAIGGH